MDRENVPRTRTPANQLAKAAGADSVPVRVDGEDSPIAAVLLVHGTFSFVSSEEEPLRKPWYSPYGMFCEAMNQRLSGRAECWPADVISVLPWSLPAKGKLRRYSGRRSFTWSGENSEHARRQAGRRLAEGLFALEGASVPITSSGTAMAER